MSRRSVGVVLGLVLLIGLQSCGRPLRSSSRFSPRTAMHALVPQPVTVEVQAGEPFTVSQDTRIFVPAGDADARRIGAYLADLLTFSGEPALAIEDARGPVPPGTISLTIGPGRSDGPDAYEIAVDSAEVTVTARGPSGLFYAVQTLRQLLPPAIEHHAALPQPLSLAPVRIADVPRFGWRGAMLDVSRHFFGIAEVKRYIDLIAMLKLNRLHLHLSNDQGWRIEIKSWPNLARHGGSTQVGGGPGGFYTQAEYADLVKYAADRFVTIVPEIDMPGHTNAALASYPELNCDGIAPPLYTGIKVGFSALCVDKDVTWRFIDDVVREIAALTPGRWFHIGGDEVEKLTAAQYNGFVERVQRVVAAHGKEAVGWDEIAAAPLLPSTVVQHWRPKGALTDAVAKNAALIMSPAHLTYVDMKYDDATPIGLNWAAVIGLKTAYDWDPESLVAGVPPRAILGVEAPLWSETVATMGDIELLAFPRIAAIAEIGWTPRASRRWPAFRDRIATHGPRWSAMGINFYRSPEVDWAR